jgi:hypothetical protein
MARPQFDVLRWSFILLAGVIVAELATTLFSAAGCIWLVMSRQAEIGACTGLGSIAREIFSELLTAILALLLAAKTPPPPE